MTIEAFIQEGEFEQALAELRAATGGEVKDLSQLLLVFNLEVRLEQFAEAEATMQRLLQLAPAEVAGGLTAFLMCAHSERAQAARLRDPELAGQRAAILPPPPFAYAYVKAARLRAASDHAGVVAALAEANAHRPAVTGTLTWIGGRTVRFTDLLDSDDLTGATLPCFAGGGLLEFPYAQLRSLRFFRGPSSFDALWLPLELTLNNGELHRLRVPSLYAGTGLAAEPSSRTGTMTTWNHDHGYAVGCGQRDLKVFTEGGGHSMVGILQVARIDFDVAAAPPPGSAGDGGASAGSFS
jgi:protein involved in temperature-dependent protein secretion